MAFKLFVKKKEIETKLGTFHKEPKYICFLDIEVVFETKDLAEKEAKKLRNLEWYEIHETTTINHGRNYINS